MTAVRTRETTSRPRKRDLTMGCFSRLRGRDRGSYSPLSARVFTVRESLCWLTDRVRTL